MSVLKEKFKVLVNGIKDAAIDFTTLEVTTITGNISRVVSSEGDFDSKKLLKEIGEPNGTNTADLRIVAHTHMDFDHDTVNFVKTDMSEAEKELFALHNASIENAKKSRQEMLKFVSDVLGDVI